MTYLRSSLPQLLQGNDPSTLAPSYLAALSNPTSPILLIISLSALLILLSTIITVLIWIRLLVGVSLCVTVLVVIGRGSAGGVSVDVVVVLVEKGMNAAAGVISLVLGMDNSSDAIMPRPSRSAVKRIR